MQQPRRQITPKLYEKKICKPSLLHTSFLPWLFREKLAVFDFVSPAGSHCYMSYLMSTLLRIQNTFCAKLRLLGREVGRGKKYRNSHESAVWKCAPDDLARRVHWHGNVAQWWQARAVSCGPQWKHGSLSKTLCVLGQVAKHLWALVSSRISQGLWG